MRYQDLKSAMSLAARHQHLARRREELEEVLDNHRLGTVTIHFIHNPSGLAQSIELDSGMDELDFCNEVTPIVLDMIDNRMASLQAMLEDLGVEFEEGDPVAEPVEGAQ